MSWWVSGLELHASFGFVSMQNSLPIFSTAVATPTFIKVPRSVHTHMSLVKPMPMCRQPPGTSAALSAGMSAHMAVHMSA